MTRTIVVGVESIASSEAALLWAAHRAALRGWRLELVRATGSPWTALDPADSTYDDAVAQGALTILEEAARRVTRVEPRVTVGFTVDRRNPSVALCERSHDAALMVIGSHRLSTRERVFAGSLSYQIASAAFCPVVVVPQPPRGQQMVGVDTQPEGEPGLVAAHRGVVVGVDGSADSLEAVALAAAEADWTGAELHVVHAWQEPAIVAGAELYPIGMADAAREDHRLLLAETVAGLAEDHPDLVVRTHLVHGQPATALLDAAESAGLLVVGSRGRQGVVRVLLGSVSHTVLLHAPCPVMVARVRQHAPVLHG